MMFSLGSSSYLLDLVLVVALAAVSMASAQQGEIPPPIIIPSIPLTEINQDFIHLSLVAADLALAVGADDVLTALPSYVNTDNVTVWSSEPDQALLWHDDVHQLCLVAFRTTTHTLNDWTQNLDPRMATDVCTPPVVQEGRNAATAACCRTRQGFRDAYHNPAFRIDLERAVRQCAASGADGGDGRQVILTGHSQGGAIAQVAAVHLQDLQPLTITFGQPPTMDVDTNCYQALDADQLFHYINTLQSDGGGENVKWDPVPFLDYGRADPFGNYLVIKESGTSLLRYDDDNPLPNVPIGDRVGLWNVLDVHGLDAYQQRLQGLLDTATFPILDQQQDETTSFALGTPCFAASECASGICHSQRSQCASGAIGDSCWKEADCASQNDVQQTPLTCEGIVSATCQPKRPGGAGCNENDDCLSGQCKDWTWTGWKCSGGR